MGVGHPSEINLSITPAAQTPQHMCRTTFIKELQDSNYYVKIGERFTIYLELSLLKELQNSNYFIKIGERCAAKACLLAVGQQGTSGKDIMALSCW